MSRPSPRRQQGFGLLIFVMIAAIIAFSIVIGYTGVLTRTQANQLQKSHTQYLAEVQQQLQSFYRRNAYAIDQQSLSNKVTIDDLLKGANVRSRYGMQAALSNVLSLPDGLMYRRIAVWLPSNTDAENPPDIAKFQATGQFQTCTNPSASCDTRQFVVFDSADMERELLKETLARLDRVALKAQAYFKARTLQDPEKNVSVNYFRPLANICTERDIELECLDTYTPLATLQADRSLVLSRTAKNLGLTDEDLVSAWGLPFEASNLQDAVTDDAPFTMVFRAASPAGGFYTVRAVQQL